MGNGLAVRGRVSTRGVKEAIGGEYSCLELNVANRFNFACAKGRLDEDPR